MSKEFTNTRNWGIQPIGVPVDNCTLCLVVKWPARMAAKVWPVGPVGPWTAIVFNVVVPVVFWGGLAWLAVKRFAR